jgi:hypothetical protein
MDENALQSLFDKCLDRVEHKLVASIFEGVGGYVKVRGKSPIQRDELVRLGIRISHSATSSRDWARGKGRGRADTHLQNAMRDTREAYRFFCHRSLEGYAEEMAQILRRGLTEHLGAVDALAGLVGLIED